MKTSELRTKTKDQLEGMLKDLKKEQFNLRFQKVSGELEKTHRFNEVRKTIAKIKTLFNQPEGAKTAKAAEPKAPKAAKAEPKAKKETKKKAGE